MAQVNPYNYQYSAELSAPMERTLRSRGTQDPLKVLLRLEEQAAKELAEEGDFPVTGAKIKQRLTQALKLFNP